jgi:hypothetical protein
MAMTKLTPQLLKALEGKGPHDRVKVMALLSSFILTDQEYKALDMMGCRKLGESPGWIAVEVDVDRLEPLAELSSVRKLRILGRH